MQTYSAGDAVQVTREGQLQNDFGEVLKVTTKTCRSGEGEDEGEDEGRHGGTIIVKLITGPKEGHIRSYNAHEIKRLGTAKNVRRVMSWRKAVGVLDEAEGRESR